MPPGPSWSPILASDPAERARRLWRALAPERWPVPPDLLPPGTALGGGAVRDGLLGCLAERPDLDLVVPGDAVPLARELRRRRGGSCVVLDAGRSIARLVLEGWTIDLARCVGEELADDLGRRDYTVNAIALPLHPQGGAAGLVDPCGGQADLAAGRLVALSEANLLDDPLRLLRGIRVSTERGLAIEERTWGWIRRHHARLGEVAGERVVAELERLAAAPEGGCGLAQVLEAGLLRPWSAAVAPEALAVLAPAAARERGLNGAEAAAALPLARLAAALDGNALARLPLSRRLEQRCRRLRHWRARLGTGAGVGLDDLPEEERLRLHREIEADLPALLLTLAPGKARRALARWRDPADPLFHPRPPMDGARLQRELGLAPGPRLGELLERLTLERAFGRLGAAEGEILMAARRWITGKGDPRRG
ncbi:MAG: CCA tRNA nucleotidyltransferase [Synechococcaceae cyanobacterium]|nr:CCA tRNA nucleotidyltransferase [Synechococcaceae cyanobacterium]